MKKKTMVRFWGERKFEVMIPKSDALRFEELVLNQSIIEYRRKDSPYAGHYNMKVSKKTARYEGYPLKTAVIGLSGILCAMGYDELDILLPSGSSLSDYDITGDFEPDLDKINFIETAGELSFTAESEEEVEQPGGDYVCLVEITERLFPSFELFQSEITFARDEGGLRKTISSVIGYDIEVVLFHDGMRIECPGRGRTWEQAVFSLIDNIICALPGRISNNSEDVRWAIEKIIRPRGRYGNWNVFVLPNSNSTVFLKVEKKEGRELPYVGYGTCWAEAVFHAWSKALETDSCE